MKIIIGFSKPKDTKFPWFSWIIRWMQKTPYSHVYIQWYSNMAEQIMVYHANSHGINFITKDEFDKTCEKIEEFETQIEKHTYKNLIIFFLKNAGKPYGFLQAFGMFLVKVLKLKKNPFSDGRKSQVCSEVVGYILQDIIGIEILEDLEIAGPKEINEIIKNNSNFIRVL